MPHSHKYTSPDKPKNIERKVSNTLYFKDKINPATKTKKSNFILNQPPKIAKKNFLTFAESSSSHIYNDEISNYEITGLNPITQYMAH